MTNVVLTASPTIFDVVQLEPTIEAVYYQYPDCELTLRTLETYFPFFEHHPLVASLIGPDDRPSEQPDVEIDIPDINNWTMNLPTVEKFAAAIGVTLLRKTPKIFLDEYPADTDYIVLARVNHGLNEYPTFKSGETLHPSYKTLEIHTPVDSDELRNVLRTLACATLVVGPDSWATHAAAALDARVVMAMDLEDEVGRAPFNVVVTKGDEVSMRRSVDEVLFQKRYPDFLNCGNAAEFIKNKAKQYLHARFADVGCSAWPIPNGIPVDKVNREAIEEVPDNFYSGLFSSHCLEHVPEWGQELILWHRVIRPGGAMVLYLPHPRAEVWHAHTGSWVGSEHVWNPEPVTLVRYLKEVLDMHIVEYSSRRDPLWSFYIVARKK